MIASDEFQRLRPYLFSMAYRMLGSASEAEDVLQDAWLRSARDPDAPLSPKAWLSTVVTRLCLDRLKSARAQREEYVGLWLPEPVPTAELVSAEERASRLESITLAFLVLLETLGPAERAAFILREVFDTDYADVARALGVTEASARQLVHRAKGRVAEGRRRFEPSPEVHREIVARFVEAAQQGDLARLTELLADDAVFNADGGGKVAAARKPVVGAAAVAYLMRALTGRAARSIDADPDAWRVGFADLNGEPAFLAFHRDRLDTVFVCSVMDGRIAAIRAIRNPDKLRWIAGRLAAPES